MALKGELMEVRFICIDQENAYYYDKLPRLI